MRIRRSHMESYYQISAQGVNHMSIRIETMIQCYTDWLIQEIRQGHLPYYINIMFHQLPGPSNRDIIEQMQSAIYKSFYPALCKQFARHPHRKSQEYLLPGARLFPDLPVWKRHKDSCSKTILNRGLHYTGFILVPPKSRLKENFCEHIKRKQHLYVDHTYNNRSLYNHGGIKRIHVVPIDRDPYNITDYAMKTIKAGKVDDATIIILPRTMSEMKSNTPVLDAKSRALKDIQAETGISDEMAEVFYSKNRR
jgi:hypothetical protein